MRSEKTKANDLFLLMLNLSQISLREKIIDVFLEAINEIWQNINPKFSSSYSESQNNSIEISTAGSNYGFISIDNFNELKTEDQDLLHNACGMLAIILRKNEHEILLADEKLNLHALVEKRTHHLNKEIQDRKQAEQALQKSEQRFRELANLLPQTVFEVDVQGNLTYTNQMGLEATGYSLEDIKKGLNVKQTIVPNEHSKLLTNFSRIIKERIGSNNEYMLLRKDGTVFPGIIFSSPIVQNDKVVGLRGIVVDISERKIVEEEKEKLKTQLHQAQKMEAIGNLAGGIAHDFNNILSSIIGFTELALEAAPVGSSQKDDLEEVYIAGNRAKELVQQILAFARQSEKETKPIRLSDIVTEVLKLLRPSTPTSIDIKPIINSTATVMGNDSQLHQIVMNICTNAIHSLQKSGDTLEITLRNIVRKDSEFEFSKLPSGEYVELIITDNGPGIDPAIIENIFEPYFTTKGVGEGSGMGLAMVKGIVESYGGDIHVKSELGKKTSFIIRFPVATGKKYEDLAQVDPVASGTERILFVDDELPIARMGSRMLESLGYMVNMRTGSFEALELFKEKPDSFDLIITDMTMPSMTGDLLSIEMRKIRDDIPIILCTGYSNKINDEGAKKIGIDAFVYKPFTKPELAKTIREVLDAE